MARGRRPKGTGRGGVEDEDLCVVCVGMWFSLLVVIIYWYVSKRQKGNEIKDSCWLNKCPNKNRVWGDLTNVPFMQPQRERERKALLSCHLRLSMSRTKRAVRGGRPYCIWKQDKDDTCSPPNLCPLHFCSFFSIFFCCFVLLGFVVAL